MEAGGAHTPFHFSPLTTQTPPIHLFICPMSNVQCPPACKSSQETSKISDRLRVVALAVEFDVASLHVLDVVRVRLRSALLRSCSLLDVLGRRDDVILIFLRAGKDLLRNDGRAHVLSSMS